MTALLAICVVFAVLFYVALAAVFIAVVLLEPLGVVKDPDPCECAGCRGIWADWP